MDLPVLFTQTDCSDSVAEGTQVRAWLIQHGINFVEHNVTGDLAAAEALYETGLFATPLLIADGTKVLGYRPRELAAALSRDQRDAA